MFLIYYKLCNVHNQSLNADFYDYIVFTPVKVTYIRKELLLKIQNDTLCKKLY